MEACIGYSKRSLIIIFMIFSHIGWLWEVAVTSAVCGIVANRGFMYGPWLPVYGTGVLLIITIMGRQRVGAFKIFLGSAALCGGLEYFTALLLEYFFHAKWWDYSGTVFDLNGRSNALAIVIFGFAGCFVIRHAAPFLNSCINKLSFRTQTMLCLVFGLIFMTDYAYSLFNPNMGSGITF